MKQSGIGTPPGLHVGMIMDGNGRWAVARGRARVAGHRVGAKVVRSIVEAAPDLGIDVLTLYAFSADNWKRPSREVAALMRLFRAYLAAETARCVQNGVRVSIIGRRDRLPPVLLRAIDAAEAATADCGRLLLRIAIDYSAREAIIGAAMLGCRCGTREEFSALIAQATHSLPTREVDLLIRTGGEQRLSDFLLWECAYAELMFETCLWPDFDVDRLGQALWEFRQRDRRFGGLPQAAAG
ncbi:MAG: di-trans,poly-cis-decaprenylcistransferase [Gemmatimonas sp.]|nr:di-trans,poly-cis-decaprenylcistransferase [Gemmatimonas sp.]